MKNYYYPLITLLLIWSGRTDAQSIIRGPYLQLGTTSSMVIKWRTDIPTSSRVWYGPSPTNLAFTQSVNGSFTDHEVTVGGLPANTTFYYAVGNTSGQLMTPTNEHYFRTSPTPGTAGSTTIWVLGDAGEDTDEQRSVRDAFYSFNGSQHADVILALGDNAYNDGTDEEYQYAWFQDMFEASLINSVVWPCPGNHDIRSASSITETGVYYDIFTLPRNGEAGGVPSGTEAYYSFNYGDIHFISLNSEDIDQSLSSPMLSWLQQDLAANTLPWVVAFLHRGVYHSTATADFRHNFLPVLEAGGVDLVLGGHQHSYRRSYLIDGHYGDGNGSFDPNIMALDTGNGRTDGDGAYQKPSGNTANAGAVYMVTGSAGSVNPLPSPVIFMPYEAGEPEGLGSVHIAVSGGVMNLTFINYENQVLDYFTIQKQVFVGTPPVVSVTAPANGTNFTSPQVATITADASDSDGSITQVEFFVNNLSIGTDNQVPYSIDYTIPANGTYNVAAYATDNDGNTTPSSDVQFTVGPVTTCSRVAQSSDDGEEQAGAVDLASSDLELTTDGSNVQTVGMRFSGLNIPQGATITNAYLQFTVDENTNDNPCGLTIYGEASDDAATFDGQDFSISGRPRVANSVSWTPSDWLNVGDAGYAQQTPDIASIIQEIVNRPGFSANNSIALFIEGTGRRTAESFDGTAGSAPELCVEYTAEPIVYDCPDLSANIGDACDDEDNTTDNDEIIPGCTCAGTPTACTNIGDDDDDGACKDEDCDDFNPDINPSAQEACDGIDNDCDGLVDDGDPSVAGQATWYADNDGDGFGDSNNAVQACSQPAGFVSDNTDCNDSNANANPAAQEVCDGIDNDCDGLVDDGDPSVAGQAAWYADTDGDGFGDSNNAVQACSQPAGFVADNTDCDDTNASSGNNVNDADCDGVPAGMDCNDNDPSVITTNVGDADCDSVPTAQDCNDNDPSAGSSAGDMDCDGVPSTVDCNDNDADITTQVGDACDDEDPNTTGETIQADCSCGGGTMTPTTTCSTIDNSSDDAEERADNGRVDLTSSDLELCTDRGNSQYVGLRFNNLNIPQGANITGAYIQFTVDESRNNDPCNLTISGQAADNAATFTGEDYNISGRPRTLNTVAWSPAQWQSVGDAGPAQQTVDISAIVQEIVNRGGYTSSSSIAFIIEGTGRRVAESFNGNSVPAQLCVSFQDMPPDYDCPNLSANIGDACDDGDNTTVDDVVNIECECKGMDTPCTNIGDDDNDGACKDVDCDDFDPNINPSAQEICDGIDNDCDGLVDDGDPSVAGQATWYADTDGDGFGDSNNPVQACSQPAGFVSDNTDCNDSNANANPAAQEVCDGIDNDCDGLVDDGDPSVAGQAAWYADTDGDGFGDPNNAVQACSQPAGFVADNTDCDDTNASSGNNVNDADCDGVPAGMDCNDNDPSVITTNVGDADCDNVPTAQDCNDNDPSAGSSAGDMDCDGVPSTVDCNDNDPDITTQVGDACDDENPNTTGETIQADCSCGGGSTLPTQACSIISDGNDDAEEEQSGRVTLNGNDLELTTDPRFGVQTVGLRFNGLNIPQGAVITNAYVQFTVDEAVNDNPCNLNIYGQASDDAQSFTSSDLDVSGRPRTNAVVNWMPPEWQAVGEAGPGQQTPDLSAIIQEVVGRSGYTAASSIVLIIDGSGRRTAESANGPPHGLPVLCVDYLHPSMGNRPQAPTAVSTERTGASIPSIEPGEGGLPGSLSVYPNPAGEKLIASFESANEGPVQVLARDVNGRILIRERWEAQRGKNTFVLDGLSLPNGVYFLQLRSENAVATVKFAISK